MRQPMEPLGSAVEPLMRAVDGAVWVRWDDVHRRLYVGRYTVGQGWTAHTFDTVTGELADQPWPLAPESVALRGYDRAFADAVEERIRMGY